MLFEYLNVLAVFFAGVCACNVHSSSSFSSLSLNTADGNVSWTVQNKNGSILFDAHVPGGVYSDLRAGGVLGDVLVGFNDVLSRWVARDTWTYTARFYVSRDQLSARVAHLTLHGVDTVAFIELNDNPLGSTDNMFVRYIFDTKPHLQEGLNVLKLEFASPIETADGRSTRHFTPPACVPSVYNGECHANQLRKMQASFGWDWGPAFPSVGIWKPISVEFFNGVVLRSVTTHITKAEGIWKLKLKAQLETALQESVVVDGFLEARVSLNAGQGMTTGDRVSAIASEGSAETELNFEISENAVSLWWPNGFGEQPLYDLHVAFTDRDHSQEMSRAHVQIGFRTLELVEEDPILELGNTTAATGLTFYFKVNGYPLFMKGSNWIPAHILPELGSDEATVDALLGAARDTHMAMLRVWGGGVYESDHFYRRCDQLGLLVWQDFLFACSMYPTDADFLRSVNTEIIQNVIRLQHHTSIAVWSGNNENEAALQGNWYGTKSDFEKYKTEYVKLYAQTIKPIVEALDPGRRYLVSSPSNGLESEREGFVAKNPYDSHYGDTHYYNYLADGWSMSIYPTTRFASEYGFQAMPSMKSLRTATNQSEDFRLDSDFSKHRQHSPGGYMFMQVLIERHLKISSSDEDYFKKFIFYSQISQAMAVKAETEFYRQSQADWYTMGALYWQLNDVWQAPSWASIEYGGKWKMVHYFAKSFFAPVLISPRVLPSGDIDVYLINDRFVPLEDVLITVETLSFDGLQILKCDMYTGNAGPLKAAKQNIKISALDVGHNNSIFLKFSVIKQEAELIETLESGSPYNYVFPVPLKDVVGLREPNIQINVPQRTKHMQDGRARHTVELTVDTVVLFLWLESTLEGRFGNNGLILTQQQTTVHFFAKTHYSPSDLVKSITYQFYIN